MKKSDASEMDVMQAVARCLKNAPDRKDGGGRISSQKTTAEGVKNRHKKTTARDTKSR